MENKTTNIIGMAIKLAIIVPILILGLSVMFSGVHVENSAPEVVEEFREGGLLTSTTMFSFVAIGLCAFLVLAFFVVLLVTQPKKAIKSILGIILVGVLYVILNAIGTADTNESLRLAEDVQVEQNVIDSSTAGIWTAAITLIVGIAAILLGPVINLVRKN
ncbi:hypothetical protein [Lishizhenia sp.]|uniref:hypothetical protein n=1 Tax=Lishizhenia sp. TaxID=2497594 RepID=UPI00299D7ECB|nr:hypothetical protein [Lishizhenia sp.]MDX1445952.1 hypothetical protein [Lishizhenia sp.]